MRKFTCLVALVSAVACTGKADGTSNGANSALAPSSLSSASGAPSGLSVSASVSAPGVGQPSKSATIALPTLSSGVPSVSAASSSVAPTAQVAPTQSASAATPNPPDAGVGCVGSACETVSETATSCKESGPGLSNCGPNADENCCVSLPVTGGTFFRTYSSNGTRVTGTSAPATISSFRLDKYEMTVGRFRKYVEYLTNGGKPPAAGSGKHTHLNAGKGLADAKQAGAFEPGWDTAWDKEIPSGSGAAAQWNSKLKCNSYGTWTNTAGGNELLPLTCMRWVEAHAFCIWDGGFLPSEAEWKYAAAGGDEQRMYAWGAADPGSDNKYAILDCLYPNKSRGNCTGTVNCAPVGVTPLGVGRFGQFDLAGNVWEWNIDVYAGYSNSCTDCATFSGGQNRVLPGGGFHTGLMPYMLASNRQAVDYNFTYRGDYGVGVRCARTP
jgi:formylglycine-generating enzyme